MVSIATCALTCPGASTDCSTAATVPITSDGYFAINRNVFISISPILIAAVGPRKALDQWLEPAPIRVGPVRVPRFDCRLDAGELRIGELEVFGRERDRGVPRHALLAGDHLAFHLDRLRFVGVERNAVLNGPDRMNRPHVCPLRAEEGVQVQALGVIKRKFHGLSFSGGHGWRAFGQLAACSEVAAHESPFCVIDTCPDFATYFRQSASSS